VIEEAPVPKWRCCTCCNHPGPGRGMFHPAARSGQL